ncbi:hypothetical protein GCM10023178_63880 [Actinomadura luteofluorescens]
MVRMRRIDPRLLLIAGAAFISVSAILFRLSGVSSGTAAFFRCALALPVLVPLALWERRRTGPRRRAGVDVIAGLLLGADFVLWGASIDGVGAGIATVLGCDAVFLAPTWVPKAGPLTDLGCETGEDGFVKTDPTGRTSVPGVWAAGNVVVPSGQVIMAAAAGAMAAAMINADLVEEEVARELSVSKSRPTSLA